MSRTSTKEYLHRIQEDYLGEWDRRKRGRMLDEACRVTGLDRKYVNKILLGHREYRERKGRGKGHSPAAEALLVRAWEGAGCPCAKYLKSSIDKVLADLGELENVPEEDARQVLAMSASTMERILRGKPRSARVWNRRTRRSGCNRVMARIPCESGERVRACEVPPGDIQVDSVAFCGGESGGDFFWAATATDRKTQWFEAHASWNLCSANYVPAFEANLRGFPFPVRGIHSDNGSEFLNAVIFAREHGHWPQARLSRSWPGRKNHNAHIEQKNGSVLRTFAGDVRLADPRLKRAFDLLLEAITLYNNYFRPCVMLLSKTKRPDGKGWRCVYDEPKTPAQRALESGVLTERAKKAIEDTLAHTNGVWLMELLRKRYRHLLALKRELGRGKPSTGGGAGSSSDSPLRGAPPGTSSANPAPLPAAP
ncbi:MAG: transposase family protein, partial [Kiritimatiellae bacterium]|nr:transposase family protein [Kiritimatiellia bacterium]